MQGSSKNLYVLSEQHIQINQSIDIQKLKTHLAEQHKINLKTLKSIIDKFYNIIKNQSSVLRVNGTATVVGDIHGQLYDLLKILQLNKKYQTKKSHNLIFLGDYVDRGINSVQVVILLMVLKIKYPQQIFLLRGNHQSRLMTSIYNFQRQCNQKYSKDIYLLLIDCFQALPLACILNSKYFCVHGGVSNKLKDISEINGIDRFTEVPSVGLFCDLLWSDPIYNPNGLIYGSDFNKDRQCSVFFDKDTINNLLKKNNLMTVIRAHEVFLEGYRQHYWNGQQNHPPVITIFSAPNYGNVMGNLGAIMHIEDNNFEIKQIKKDKVHKKLSDKLDVFNWSIPQIFNVTNQVFINIIDRIIQLYIPQMKDLSQQQKIKQFLKYDQQYNKKKPKQFIKTGKVQKIPSDTQSLYRRSKQYFKQYPSKFQ